MLRFKSFSKEKKQNKDPHEYYLIWIQPQQNADLSIRANVIQPQNNIHIIWKSSIHIIDSSYKNTKDTK